MVEHRARLVLADGQRLRTPGFRYNLGSKAPEKWKCVALCPGETSSIGDFKYSNWASSWMLPPDSKKRSSVLHNRRRRMV